VQYGRRQGNLLIPSVAGIWLIIFVFLSYNAFVLWHSYNYYVREAGNRALSLVRLVEQHASAEIERTNAALVEATDHLQSDDFVWGMRLSERQSQKISAMLFERQRRAPGILSISLTDKDGLVFANSLGVPPGNSLSNRKYFLDLKAWPQTVPRVSEALYGRVSNRWGIQIARRIDLSDGSFAGMIVANLGLSENFEQFYQTIGLGPNDLISLRDADNRVLVRYPVRTELLGKVIEGESSSNQKIRLGVSEQVVLSKSPVDDVERITGIRRLQRHAIFAIVGLERNVAMAPWYKELRQAVYFAVGALAAAALFSHLLARRVQMEDEFLHTETRFRYAMEATSDGIWDWDLATDNMYFSPTYFTMLGYEPGEFPSTSRSWIDLIHPDDRHHSVATAQDCIENRCESFSREFRMKARDGSWKWILGRGRAVLRDADGRAQRMIGTHVDITKGKELEEKLQQLARTDPLCEFRRIPAT